MRFVAAAVAALLFVPAASAATAKPRQAPAARDWTTVATVAPSGGFVLGNPAAKAKLVEYASFTCPHCAHFSNTAMEALRANYIRTGKVSLEVRTATRDRIDLAAALVVRCGGPGPYFARAERIFATQEQWLPAAISSDAAQRTGGPADVLASLALAAGFDKSLRIPAARIKACVADKADAARVAAMTDEAWNERGIAGTPSFLVNGVTVGGSDWGSVEAALRAAIG